MLPKRRLRTDKREPLGAGQIRQAARYQPKPTVFIAGGKPAAKSKAEQLAKEIGFDSVDAGDLVASKAAAIKGQALTRLRRR